jgi:hypothetical protein
MKGNLLKSAVIVMVVALAGVRPAFAAYLDPNTGGMMFQLLAVLFGLFSGLILFFSGRIRMLYYRTMRKLRGSKEEDETAETPEKTED